jgi:hypothetical protein
MTPDITTADVEALLGRAFAYAVPSRSRDAMNGRVQAATVSRVSRRGVTFRKPGRRILLGLIAAALLTGGVAAGGTLFNSLTAGAPLLEDVWARASVIRQSATSAGYTVVLERAAADRDRVWVAVSVKAESRAAAVALGRMRVIDANGIVMDGGTGVGSGDIRGVTASLFGFKVPAGVTPEGPFTLEVTSLMTPSTEDVAGHWAFTFDVPLTPAFTRSH